MKFTKSGMFLTSPIPVLRTASCCLLAYQLGTEAASKLALPPWNPATAVRPVNPSPFKYVAGPRTVKSQPQWGQPGGGIEYRIGGF